MVHRKTLQSKNLEFNVESGVKFHIWLTEPEPCLQDGKATRKVESSHKITKAKTRLHSSFWHRWRDHEKSCTTILNWHFCSYISVTLVGFMVRNYTRITFIQVIYMEIHLSCIRIQGYPGGSTDIVLASEKCIVTSICWTIPPLLYCFWRWKQCTLSEAEAHETNCRSLPVVHTMLPWVTLCQPLLPPIFARFGKFS